jgi:RimJ/RimL family protein N-acetyltransferase
MSRIIRALGALHVYTVSLGVVGYGPGTRTVDLALIAPQHVSADVILAAAESAGESAHITVGSPDAGRDLPTRMLDAATFLVKHPEDAPTVAAGVVEADNVQVIAATEGADDRADVLRLQWTADRHVLLQRNWAPFAGAEQARASALLRLSSAIARLSGDDDVTGWIDPVRDSTVWIRLARPEDAHAVAAMHERCSERSRFQRYFSLTEWRDLQLRRLAGGHRGATLVAMSRDGDIVALGNVFPEAPDEGRSAEIALIVEDAHQGTGVGTALLRRMLQVAPTMGFTEVVAHVLADNAGMKHLLEATGLAWTTTVESGVASMTARVAPG